MAVSRREAFSRNLFHPAHTAASKCGEKFGLIGYQVVEALGSGTGVLPVNRMAVPQQMTLPPATAIP
ncbi:MAG: hypothetical protein P4N24_02865 [Acidobacteriota bacterium]|nr:hypothetical protein [Acidobacteriota bacterium]